jgi:hypothetical protein
MKKTIIILTMLLLTACGAKYNYTVSDAKVTSKTAYASCGGCYDSYYVSVSKDGSVYTYLVDDVSYRLANEGARVDVWVNNASKSHMEPTKELRNDQ